jgi:hypothetical protein
LSVVFAAAVAFLVAGFAALAAAVSFFGDILGVSAEVPAAYLCRCPHLFECGRKGRFSCRNVHPTKKVGSSHFLAFFGKKLQDFFASFSFPFHEVVVLVTISSHLCG